MKEIQMMPTLKEVISEVLSLMYFIFEDDEEPFEQGTDNDYKIFTIDYWNKEKYQIVFKIHKKIMHLMVENFEGVKAENLKEKDINSGIKEFVNIVCGNYISKFPDKMNMGLPTYSSEENIEENEYDNLVEEKDFWFENAHMFVQIVK